jgi:endoglucanase
VTKIFERLYIIMRLFCVLAMLCFCCYASAEKAVLLSPPSERMSVSLPDSNISVRLAVKGRNIVDSNGNVKKLRGIYTRAEWLNSEQDVELFKDWGVNFVRILLTHDPNYWQTVNDSKKDINKRCILLEENLRHMDQRVAWLEKNKIYFMMEIHWRALGVEDNLEKPDLLSRQFAQMYQILARRYSGSNYLMGFCTFSEIHILPHRYNDYNKIRRAIVDSIHEVDQRFIVSLTGTWWGSVGSLSDKIYIDRPNTIYDFHFYSPRKFTHYREHYGDLRYPGFMSDGWLRSVKLVDMNYLKKELKPAIDFSKKWNVPVWCGEFGAFNNPPDNSSERWLRDTTGLFESCNMPWAIWRWKPGLRDVPDVWKELWQGKTGRYATISPHGGKYADPVSVKILSLASDANIYYTLDGSEPDEKSNVYNGPVKITKTTTVKARLFKNGPLDTAVFEIEGSKEKFCLVNLLNKY